MLERFKKTGAHLTAMAITVLPKQLAATYEPTERTKVIRLMDNQPEQRETYPPLKESPLYISVQEYFFNDENPDERWPTDPVAKDYELRRFLQENKRLFDEDIAMKIMADFEDGQEFKDLLVHCSAGISRSPAIAIAMNDIYGLGEDPLKMRTKYNKHNTFVYRIMMETAEKLGKY